MADDSDDDVPQLSAEALAALQEFYESVDESKQGNGTAIEENWQLSQFWYDEETINRLVDVTLKAIGQDGKIALISCPSLYNKLKQECNATHEITVFEYDKRFSIFGTDFIFYDYKNPLNVPLERHEYYDLVLADPPFLSEECLNKTSQTIKLLSKGKIVLCTGAVMTDLAEKLLGVKKSSFEPKHKNNLANEFCCYTNFDIDSLIPSK